MLWLCWTLVTEADRKTSSRKQSSEAPPLGTLLPRQQSLEAVGHLTSVANDFAPPLHRVLDQLPTAHAQQKGVIMRTITAI